MKKLLPVTFSIFCFFPAVAQQDMVTFKKGDRTIALFRKDSYFAFQLRDKEWLAGYITKVQNDSFYIRPLRIVYRITYIDTLYSEVVPFALSDVYAVPKKGVQIDYINGRFQIATTGGHLHWYWIKNGWLFRTLGVGYLLLNVANGIIQNDFTFSDPALPVAAGVLLLGVLLKHSYKPVLCIRKRYHLQSIKVP